MSKKFVTRSQTKQEFYSVTSFRFKKGALTDSPYDPDENNWMTYFILRGRTLFVGTLYNLEGGYEIKYLVSRGGPDEETAINVARLTQQFLAKREGPVSEEEAAIVARALAPDGFLQSKWNPESFSRRDILTCWNPCEMDDSIFYEISAELRKIQSEAIAGMSIMAPR
jgi:hypothetical protein